jgi:hypothetical protein
MARPMRRYNKPLGSAPQEMEWIAGHKRDRGFLGRSEHSYVPRRNDLKPVDDVGVASAAGSQLNQFAALEVLKSAEEAVAMTGERDIPPLSREGSSRNSADSVIESQRVHAVQDRGDQTNRPNFENS